MNTKVSLDQTNIFDAATDQILNFARDAAGLTFESGAGRDYIISQIFEALEWDAYKPEDDATHVVINLPLTKDEKHPYTGGLNGNMFAIKGGEDVEVPIGYYNTMVESAKNRFRIENVGQHGETQEGGPASRRIPLGALEMRVVKFLNKGVKKVQAEVKKKAKKAAIEKVKKDFLDQGE